MKITVLLLLVLSPIFLQGCLRTRGLLTRDITDDILYFNKIEGILKGRNGDPAANRLVVS